MSREQSFRLICASLALWALASCASNPYVFLPAGEAGQNADRAQRGKAYYPVPADAPTGTVRTMSGGIVKLKPQDGGDKIAALHLRMVVSNQSSDAAWTLNPQIQTVSFPNRGPQIAPLFVRTDSRPTTANAVLAKGEMRTFDLYFPLPDEEKTADNIPEFDFHWRVMAGSKSVDETTSFDRVPAYYDTIVAYPYSYPYPYYFPGYGPYYYPYGYGWGGAPIGVVPVAPVTPPSKPVIIHH